MKYTLLEVLCGWIPVLLVDLFVVYLFVGLAKRSDNNEQHQSD
jgi:hypothetical protein